MKELQKAKVRLLLSQPFFATILLNCKVKEDKSIPTACTNGKEIRYNPEFFKSLKKQENIDEIVFVLAHEVLHIAFLHTTRIGNRNPKKWNIACDYAINPILINSGLTMPKGGLNDKKYHGKSAEEIYNLLPQDCEGEGDGDGNGMGGVEKGYETETEREQLEQEIKQVVASAYSTAKKAGNMPGGLEGIIDDLLEPTVNWREQLYKFVSEIAKNDYTWSLPNSRYIASGLYLPMLRNEEVGNIIMFADTSGSVSDHELSQFGGELQSILQTFNMGFTIVYCDTDISVQYVEPDEILELHYTGRGGTDFVPPFEYVAREGIDPKCALYFTDGGCSNFPPTPDYPVLWASTMRHFEPPFGEVVFVDTQQGVS